MIRSIFTAVFVLTASSQANAQTFVIPIQIHDAGLLQPSGALASERYLEVTLESANRWFESAGICFFVQAHQPFPEGETYETLKPQLPRGGAIHTAIVRRVSNQGEALNGVATPALRIMALSRLRANRLTMAHELGHILGLEHAESGVMDSDRDWWNPREEMSQVDMATVRRGAREITSDFGRFPASRCRRYSVPDPDGIAADDPLLIHATRRYSTGSRYVGTLLFGKRHGLGAMEYASDGATYRGMWRVGQRHGQGAYAQGRRRYVGDWASGDRHGYGVEVYSNGGRYEGAFHDNQRHGLGEYRVSGSHYRGAWEEGQRHGFGQYNFANGDRHEGLWRSDQQHGYGSHRYASGRRLVGEWRSGQHTPSASTCAR